jgi:hypothetical protein
MHACMYVYMSVTRCVVTKLQMLQTPHLAQIYLVTIEIDLTKRKRRHKISAILATSRHLEFLKANISKYYNF